MRWLTTALLITSLLVQAGAWNEADLQKLREPLPFAPLVKSVYVCCELQGTNRLFSV